MYFVSVLLELWCQCFSDGLHLVSAFEYCISFTCRCSCCQQVCLSHLEKLRTKNRETNYLHLRHQPLGNRHMEVLVSFQLKLDLILLYIFNSTPCQAYFVLCRPIFDILELNNIVIFDFQNPFRISKLINESQL